MALFTGTEFVIGALMTGWLVWVGVGGMAGGRLVERYGWTGFPAFERTGVATALLLPATVAGIRIGRSLLCDPPGNFPAFSTALLFSILVIAPFGLVYGTLYNMASLQWRGTSGDLRGGISRVYVWEAAGSLIGAMLFSFLLLRLFSQFTAASVVTVVVAAILLVPRRAVRGFGWRISAALLLVLVAAVAAPRMNELTTRMMFPGYSVEASVSSKYSELVAASREGSLSFFSGGTRLLTIPEPERTEETVHIPLLLHPEPREVLLIGGSLGGGWQEASKHGTVRRIDCVELDGDLVRLSMELAREQETGREEGSGGTFRLDFIETDGRYYLSRRGRTYDVIILGAPPPVNLQWNRYYTREFFEAARDALAERGIFALSHPSSENFLSREQVNVLGTIEATMAEVFDELTILPGSTCHFLGGETSLHPDSIIVRLERRDIVTSYVSGEFLPFRFSRERIASLRESLDGAVGARENTDSRPTLPFLELLLESERLGSGAMGLLDRLAGLPRFLPTALLGAVLIALFALARARAAPRIAALSVGLSAFLFQLAVMLSYQAQTGLLYHAIVLLTALFMGGAAAGAAFSSERRNPGRRELRLVHGGFVLLALLLLVSYRLPDREMLMRISGGGFFHILSGLGGFVTGSYYPMVVRTAFRRGSGPPAVFYAYDLFGAAVGGMLGGLVLFPLSGLTGIAVLIVSVQAGAALLLVRKW